MGVKLCLSPQRRRIRLRVLEKRALRRIFGPKSEFLRGNRRRLHKGELHNLYASPNIIIVIKSRRIALARHVARVAEVRNWYSILVGKSEEKRPFGRPRCR
jgi:hypothetical protein